MRALLLFLVLLLAGCGAAPEFEKVPMSVYVLFLSGQSNATGTDAANPPTGLPDATIPFWVNDYYYNDGTHSFGSLNVRTAHNNYYATEITIAKRLKAAGLKVAVVKLTQGATFINRWIPTAPTGHPGSKVYVELAEAWAALPAQFAGETNFIPLFVWDQGEAEARYSDLPTVEHWSDDFAAIKAGVEGVVGRTIPIPHIVRTCSTIVDKTFPGVLEAEQASVTDAAHLYDTNTLSFQGDNIHRTGLSEQTLGNTIADQMLKDIFMGTISNYLAHKLLDHALGGGDYTPPATTYMAALVSGVEASQIARKAVTGNTTNWPAASSRTISLAVAHDFAAASADAGAIDELRLYDASSGGNELGRCPLPTAVTINNGGVLTVPIGGLGFTLSPGCMSDYLAHKLLNLALAQTAYTRPATVYQSAYIGNPQGAGTQMHPARVAITNNSTNWPAASGRAKSLGAAQAHASTTSNLGTATYVAVHDASTAGNLLCSGALATPRLVDGSGAGGAVTLRYRANETVFTVT